MKALHVLQVTDCHLFADPDATLLGVRVRSSLEAALQAACEERTPDAILATGDLAQRPGVATYRMFLATVRRHFDGPLLCLPGNHDHGAPFAAVLPTDDLALDPWRLLAVDTHVDDVVEGTVALRELERLAAALAGGSGPALVAGHHCPVGIGCPWLDAHRIDNGQALLDVLDAAGVRAYVFGHIHQPFEQRRAGASLYGAPSTCFQFARGTPAFAVDDNKPGYRWLVLEADGGVRARVARAANYPMSIDLADRDPS